MKTHPLHEEIKLEIRDYRGREQKIISLLQKIEREKVWEQLGYNSMHQYCVIGLGLSDSEAYQFIGVARKCTEVPSLQSAIFDGTLSASTARRMLRVIEEGNSEQWIAKAVALPQKALEREVARTNPDKAIREVLRPVSETMSEFGCGMDEETEQILGRCREIAAQKLGKSCVWFEVLKMIGKEFLKHQDPVQKADRNAAKSKKAVNLVEKYTGAMPAMVRHRVNQRDRGRCQKILPGGMKCQSAFWTEIHHRVLRSEGGTDTLENLITLCSSHHDQIHDGERSDWPRINSPRGEHFR